MALVDALGSIKPHPTRPDWYAIPDSWGPTLAGVPSVQLDKKYGIVAHRSHLPILAVAHSEAQQFLEQLKTTPNLLARAAFDTETLKNGWALREHQHAAREFILNRRGTLLADQMRVGKTLSALSTHDPDSGPLVVVAPLATREVWITWFRRRWPDVRPTVVQGKTVKYFDEEDKKKPVKRRRDPGYDIIDAERFDPQVFAKAKLIFINYDILAGWKDFGFRRIGTLIFDECHVITWKAGSTAKRATAALYISTSAERVIGLSGTPMWNKPVGLYTMLSCLNPGAWGKPFNFRERYSLLTEGEYGLVSNGTQHENEFKLRLTEVMLRRTWEDVSGHLPAIERTVEVVDITERQAFEIEKQAEAVRDYSQRSTAIGNVARFRRLLAKLKLPAATDAALRVLQSEEKVIVWTWHRSVAIEIEDRLSKQGYPGYVVSGETHMDLREAIFDRWRNNGPAPLVITLAVGQVGIDLSAARQEVFAELDFTPAIVAQAEMRPFTPTQPISATYVIIDHEIERKLLEALQTKCELSYRLGVPAAESAVDVLASTFTGTTSRGEVLFDASALALAVMSDHPDIEDIENNFHGNAWTDEDD
jgi:SNF2 family DNA or RNA helicase